MEEIRAALDLNGMRQGLVGGNGTRSAVRTGKTQWIRRGGVSPSIFSHLYTLAVVANRELDWSFPLAGPAPQLQGTSYSGDAGAREHYDWHMDWGNARMKRRKVTVAAQLSTPLEEYEGGVLQLMIGAAHVDAPAGFGNVTVFPSFVLHRVTPVTRGLRLGVVSWILGEP